MDFMHDVLNEMRSCNLSPARQMSLIADGYIHRYEILGDRPGKKNGWYVINTQYSYSGKVVMWAAFGSWKTGFKHTWCSAKRNELHPQDYSKIMAGINEAKRKADAEKRVQQAKAAETAFNLWHSYVSADHGHPYLIKKRIPPFCARQVGEDLVLPIVDCDQKIWSLQYIDPAGNKLLLTGGAKKANFILVSGSIRGEKIFMGEGFATCAILALLYPDATVVAAVDAYNLEPAAIAIRERNPSAELTICGDDDRNTPGNPGATMARRAAIASGARLALPPWPFDAPLTLTDFNDLHCWLEDKAKESL